MSGKLSGWFTNLVALPMELGFSSQSSGVFNFEVTNVASFTLPT